MQVCSDGMVDGLKFMVYGKFCGRLNGCCEMVVVERYCLELLTRRGRTLRLVIHMLRASTPFWQDSPLIEYFKFLHVF